MADYGGDGRIGIGTPQANPTVEPEMAILLGPEVAVYTTRLTCPAGDSRLRLIAYLEELPRQLAAFDTMPLDVFGFACTGSSYLLGADREAVLVERLAAERGHGIVTAAQAVVAALHRLGARRIALLTPYPDWLSDASAGYWQSAGFDVCGRASIALGSGDTRSIYALASGDALAAVSRLDCTGADAVLLAGTGLPTLRVLDAIEARTGRPVLSSNLCLAWALLRAIGRLPAGPRAFRWGWERRLPALSRPS